METLVQAWVEPRLLYPRANPAEVKLPPFLAQSLQSLSAANLAANGKAIIAKTPEHKRAWFRIFYACGGTFLCWQDDETHQQTPITPEEEAQFGLSVLRSMVQDIANISGLNLFSTEIALDQNNTWQVVDYVNDPCDYRLQSKAREGVPDVVVQGVCERIAGWVKRQSRN
ncbi:MAG: hypothetical protein HC853_04240 [Anaerolineae bacterium]|nr:hypothetical protein [Anaerolineae bacterium]